ncbi:MAG: rod shape-determining protein RodA [Vulcanimicrobiaceae bacterium]
MAASALVLGCAGVLLIGSADLHAPNPGSEWHKQAIFVALGLAAMALCAAIDYHRWERWARTLYIASVALLAFVMLAGHSALGAQRWVSLGPFQFQPSEPAKLVIAIAVAALLARKGEVGWQRIGLAALGVAVPALLILKQPDLGTALVLGAILSAQLFAGASRMRYVVAYAAIVGALGALVAGTNLVLRPFQRTRLLAFLHPNADPQGAGWNLAQAKIAIGNGELYGRGLGHGSQTQLDFVPEHSRDFIFTVVGEELGFVGVCGLIGLYGIVLFGGIQAMFAARERFGALLAVGLVAMLAFHVVVNVGMTVGVMPITGIPLPFLSYGGTAVLTDFAAVGILLNIHLQRDRLVF